MHIIIAIVYTELVLIMLYCHIHVHAEIYIYISWIYTDAMNNRRRKISLTKYLPLTLLQGFEKVVWGFIVRGSWGSNITAIFWPQTYGRHVVSFRSSDAQPEPWVHSAGCWLSLLHLISIFSGPQFIRASRGPLRPGVAFFTTSRLQLRPIFNSTGSSNSTELCHRSTSTRSLKSNV